MKKNANNSQLIEPSSDLNRYLVPGHDHCEYQEGAGRPAAAAADRRGKGTLPEQTGSGGISLFSTPAIPASAPFFIHEAYDH
ncbi:hypothetical protein [Aeromonas allosaccharophila]|uniref:hypothetical protein n=1 Tax=Aeromonas allosaccharophila TaxID=656 RepID=UPI0012E041AF|nr:hypothetical protein [Aeromonas allosaccharophila]